MKKHFYKKEGAAENKFGSITCFCDAYEIAGGMVVQEDIVSGASTIFPSIEACDAHFEQKGFEKIEFPDENQIIFDYRQSLEKSGLRTMCHLDVHTAGGSYFTGHWQAEKEEDKPVGQAFFLGVNSPELFLYSEAQVTSLDDVILFFEDVFFHWNEKMHAPVEERRQYLMDLGWKIDYVQRDLQLIKRGGQQ